MSLVCSADARILSDPRDRYRTGETAAASSPLATTPLDCWLSPLHPVTGVISSICVGRGRDLYNGERNVETRALTEALGSEARLVGMFANGEISWALKLCGSISETFLLRGLYIGSC